MTEVTVSRHVEAPPEVVFQTFTDLASCPQRVEAIEKVEILTEGAVGEGTRFRETRTLFGREATEEMEVVVFDPPRRYEFAAESHGSRYRTVFTFEPTGGGTDVTLRFQAEPLTLGARVMGFMMKLMLKKMMQSCAKDLDDIKAAIEREGGRA